MTAPADEGGIDWSRAHPLSPLERLTWCEVLCRQLDEEHRTGTRPALHEIRTRLTGIEPRLDELREASSRQRPKPGLTINGVLLLVALALLGRDPEAVLAKLAAALGGLR